jgi:hypothetical protein
MKTCTECNQEKPVSEFRETYNGNNHAKKCKECELKIDKAKLQALIEKNKDETHVFITMGYPKRIVKSEIHEWIYKKYNRKYYQRG